MFAKVTPLDITYSSLDRVIPRLSKYPVLQHIIQISVERIGSLAMSEVTLNVKQTLSFPSSQLFQHLKVINLFWNRPMAWKDSKKSQTLFVSLELADKGGWDIQEHHKVPLLDVLEHNDQGKCFEELAVAFQPAISSTKRYRNTKALLASFAKHNIRPQILFWQEVLYEVYIANEPLAQKELLVVAVDIANFDVIHFAASGCNWLRRYDRGMTFLTGRPAELENSLEANYGTLARSLWPDRTFDLTGVGLHPALIEEQYHARSIFIV